MHRAITDRRDGTGTPGGAARRVVRSVLCALGQFALAPGPAPAGPLDEGAVWEHRGPGHGDVGRYAQAGAAPRQAVRLDPVSAAAWPLLGLAVTGAGDRGGGHPSGREIVA